MINLSYKALGFICAIALIALAWIVASSLLSFFVNSLVI